MRVLICDDDKNQVALMNRYVIDFFKSHSMELPEIALFYSGEELLADPLQKDIVFLDIEMKKINGIQVGFELSRKSPHTLLIIVTSYTQYLDDAMRFNSFRYLFKPVVPERLFQNLSEAVNHIQGSSIRIPVRLNEATIVLPISEIIMVEALLKKTKVVTINDSFECLQSMDDWKKTLPPLQFYRCHRGYFINLNYVIFYDHSKIKLYNDKYVAYLSKRKYADFNAAFLKYMEDHRSTQ